MFGKTVGGGKGVRQNASFILIYVSHLTKYGTLVENKLMDNIEPIICTIHKKSSFKGGGCSGWTGHTIYINFRLHL